MTSERESAVPPIDQLLRRVGVAAAAGVPGELPHNRRLTPGVWRVRLDDGRSAVLKYLRADRDRGETDWDAHWTVDDQDPRRWNYWAREPLAYQHHLTDIYADAGLHAPDCIGVDVGERDAVLLLEWIDGQPGEAWAVSSCRPAAEALGRAHAPFLLGEPMPSYPWLSRSFLHQYSSEKPVQWGLLDADEAWQRPIVRELFPPELRDGVLFVHANRERLCRISEALPITLCHLDVWPKNLLRQTDDQIVLIDWAFIGIGSLGEDAGNLVPDACFDHFIPADQLPDLERVIFDGLPSRPDISRLERRPPAGSAGHVGLLGQVRLARTPHPRPGAAGPAIPLRRRRRNRRLLQVSRTQPGSPLHHRVGPQGGKARRTTRSLGRSTLPRRCLPTHIDTRCW